MEIMTSDSFLSRCETLVIAYHNKNKSNMSKQISFGDVFLIWYCFQSSQNHKAIFKTTTPNETYYEIAYNGDKDEFYIDVFAKYDSVIIPN